MTTGPARPATLTIPFTRSRSGPLSEASAVSQARSRGHCTGSVAHQRHGADAVMLRQVIGVAVAVMVVMGMAEGCGGGKPVAA